MNKVFKVGLIGCGHIAETYFRAEKYFNNIKIIKCADINLKAARKCSKEYGVKFLSVNEILKDQEVEIILNLTIPKAHYEISKKALLNGKHVYSEKPLAINLKDGKELLKISPLILKFAKPTWKLINNFQQKKKKILFEGAQGILLDVDHGTYPFVTSSNTVASNAATGTGCGPNNLGYILGITKAYTTRVGEGPFPTELVDKIGELLGTRGKEFGTVTSRKRRCGWFDGVLVRQTIKISGIDGIALTKLDVLDELDEIKMCVEYDLNGKKIDYLPAAVEDQLKIKPIYKTFNGWKTSTNGVKNINDLPENAKKYLFAIEDFIGAKISSISTSPERDDTILVENPFEI